jgi:hypothetical protein
MAKPTINTVFTPRNAEVNHKMYVPRLALETALTRAVQGSMHPLLFGDSGTGKSWLYKKVFEQLEVEFAIANCANASRLGSITEEIRSTLIAAGTSRKTGFTENKEASVKAVVAEGKLTHQDQYTLSATEPLMDAFRAFRARSGRKQAVLVLDNLESIFKNDGLMSELADIIILLDDTRYSTFKIKLLIVGVPNGILEYFSKTKNLESVSNRLEELPRVSGMTLPQVTTLVRSGFELLEMPVPRDDLPSLAWHVFDVTLGVPQRVHEYCEKLAYAVEDRRGVFSKDSIDQADKAWTRIGLRQAYTVMESHLNAKKTTVSRRNQVIYSIGKIQHHQFDSGAIAEKIRELFPETATKTGMGISTILSELADGDMPLLSKNDKTNHYRVLDPRYTMCIRVAMYIDPTTKNVERLLFSN